MFVRGFQVRMETRNLWWPPLVVLGVCPRVSQEPQVGSREGGLWDDPKLAFVG